MVNFEVTKIPDIILEKANHANQTLFSRRLQKVKIKDLERDLRTASQGGNRHNYQKLNKMLEKSKKDVFTCEKKLT